MKISAFTLPQGLQVCSLELTGTSEGLPESYLIHGAFLQDYASPEEGLS